ncbi:MAG TPA: lamin tail domain-containing protein, partial [Sandaracinaceae bacterium]
VAARPGSGDLGEWFEVENLGSCTIDLTGLTIESPGSSGTPATHVVTSGRVAPGELFVFAQSGNAMENYGLPYDYVYGAGTTGVVFNNGADSLKLRLGTIEIDRVEWTSPTDYRVGAARQLSSTASPLSNQDIGGSAFCDATDVYANVDGEPLRGTPGMPQRPCP